jgi:hypothetical protein
MNDLAFTDIILSLCILGWGGGGALCYKQGEHKKNLHFQNDTEKISGGLKT